MSGSLWGERLSAAVFVGVALFMGRSALDFPAGGDMFPLFLSATMILVAGVMLARTILAPASYASGRHADLSLSAFKPLIMTALAVVYVLAIFRIGYYVTTAAFLVGVPILVGLRRPVLIVASALGATLFIYALFERGLQAHMPRGILF